MKYPNINRLVSAILEDNWPPGHELQGIDRDELLRRLEVEGETETVGRLDRYLDAVEADLGRLDDDGIMRVASPGDVDDDGPLPWSPEVDAVANWLFDELCG